MIGVSVELTRVWFVQERDGIHTQAPIRSIYTQLGCIAQEIAIVIVDA